MGSNGMTIRRIEVPLWTTGSFDGVLGSARILAEKFGAHVDARFIRPRPGDLILPNDFATFPAEIVTLLDEQGLKATKTARDRFERWRERHPFRLEAHGDKNRPDMVWHEETGPLGSIVTSHGRLADLILLQRPIKDDSSVGEAFEAALFGSGRPVMLVDATPSEEMFDHVLIAWNGSLEAARAVALALPLIAAAAQVSVFSVGEKEGDPADPQALIEYLSLHGITARSLSVDPSARSVSAALFSAARHAGVTMLVMGAYTHSRLRQTLLGGVTRDVLKTSGLVAVLGH
jgi:nucleotide-binding universal stress UspA family protein